MAGTSSTFPSFVSTGSFSKCVNSWVGGIETPSANFIVQLSGISSVNDKSGSLAMLVVGSSFGADIPGLD